MAERITSSARLRRILAIVPWVAEGDGPTIEEISARFDISRSDLLADLWVVFMVGLPPYTPDTLIDVVFEDDRVWITLGDYFRRPLRLTASEGLALLAAGDAGADASGGDGPLARALSKLAAALGVNLGDEGELDVSLGSTHPETLRLFNDAIARNRVVEIEYYTFGRDEVSRRQVEPARVTAKDGAWYLVAWCRQAADERVFRLDRITSAEVLDERFEPHGDMTSEVGYVAAADDLRVALRLDPSARWVPEYYPVLNCKPARDGGVTVTMAVSELPWLVRLLLRLGPAATVVSVEGGGGETVATVRSAVLGAAEEIAARYRQ
ncbi:MAG: WYL domain-containing protein [Microthrixaceae bacterium]|nr:WYL domain-containing protein [Microthrixaceae bacterium]